MQEEPGRHSRLEHPLPVDRDADRNRAAAAFEVAPADHQRRRAFVAPYPSLDRCAPRATSDLSGKAGGFGRQCPSLAEVPRRQHDLVPIHDVRTYAAEQVAGVEWPAIFT